MSAATRTLLGVRLLVAGALLSGGLVAAAISHVLAVSRGVEIVIPAQGFDPRALLTGHYAELRYSISQGDVSVSGLAPGPPAWRSVFVSIAPVETDWKVDAVSVTKPATAPQGGHVIAAEARYQSEGLVLLRYGIERVYAQQKEAEAIDKAVRGVPNTEDTRLQIVASLGSDRRLRIKALIAEGKRTDFGWW
jgi:uncharacterized membrane-anchored protein